MISPKYSLETEHEVLETLMHFSTPFNTQVQKAMLILTEECFYNRDNQQLFIMIKNCFKKKEMFHFVDILTLIPRDNQQLHSSLSWLIDNYGKMHAGESGFERYVNRLVILSKIRKQLLLASSMIADVHECVSPEESQSILSQKITEISGINYLESKHGISNSEISENYYDGKMTTDLKVPTSCHQLNELLGGGFMPKSLIIVAAAPSVGKTGFSIFLMDCIASVQSGKESLFFSIEMEYKHIWMRHVGICGKKPFDMLSDAERMQAVTKSLQVSMKIYDTAMCRSVSDIDFIITTCRMKAMENPLSVIVVDYLGLIQAKGHFDRHDLKISYITYELAQLAIELNCNIILLTQINRGAANRSSDDRCPWPHDAADSSGSHNNANYWFGADRPELYQEDLSYKNQFVFKCRKNRFGDTFETVFAFNGGSFAESLPGDFRKPTSFAKNPEKTIFPSRSKAIYQD